VSTNWLKSKNPNSAAVEREVTEDWGKSLNADTAAYCFGHRQALDRERGLRAHRERGEKIGRMYRTDAIGGGQAWNGTVYGIAVWNSPPAGREPTREQAMAAFQVGMGDVRPARAGPITTRP
jgi:hypothetical protein